MDNLQLGTFEYIIRSWHHDSKLIQECGELSDSICKGEDIKDDIGDIIVVLINICERNNLSLSECLDCAWSDIKDRKGKMVEGVFVKEADHAKSV